jgi:ABC-type antimicrobial peptide transport system permease subunit
MLKNYFKTGLRNLLKNKLSSSINIAGLSLAVGCSLVIFKFFDWSTHLDSFHSKLNNLFVAEKIVDKNGNLQYYGKSPSPLGAALKNDFPQIKNSARVSYNDCVIKLGDNVLGENVCFVDDAFYSMFDFPILRGNKNQFTNPEGIVLTEELSERLFGKTNSMGKNVSMQFNINGKKTPVNFIVTGVIDRRPKESSFYFSALIPYKKMISLGMDKNGDWHHSVDITFLEADNERSFLKINQQSKEYLQLYNTANPDDKISAFYFQPLKTMNLEGYKVIPQRFASSNIAALIMLFVIGIATLLLVYFNYMNIAIASAFKRLKEIGVRKVMGSNRKQIIVQFVFENLILCTIAVILGLMLAKLIFLPWFSQLANIDFAPNLFDNYRIWIALVSLIVLSALSGSAYPSFYISSFKPINILKSTSQTKSKNRFRKSLLGIQFFLTFLTISTALAFIKETKDIKAKSWGYNPANNVVVRLDKSADFEAFKSELKNNKSVVSVSGSVQPLGNYSRQFVVKTEGTEQTVQGLNVLPGLASQLEIHVTKGRDLNEQYQTDEMSVVLVNQAFLRQMHWTSAIGKTLEYGTKKYTVVGEVNDFHFENFQTPVAPFIIMGCRPEEINFVYIKTTSGLFSNARANIQTVWKRVNPDLPFDYYQQENIFDNYFNGFEQVSKVLSAASIIMILISTSGIFGLALLILAKKMKEISIRKVLGAGMGNIVYVINKEFLFAIGCAIVFGFPLSWWVTRTLFNQIAPESTVSFFPLVLALISLFIMTAISVSWHIYKAYSGKPSAYLKDE